ncbi:MAG: caspase family protein [Spirulinaceae cyanobacterium]
MAKRYALVVAISQYKHLRSLENVIRDGEAIVQKLEEHSFEVTKYPCKWIEDEYSYKLKSSSVKADDLFKEIKTFLLKTAQHSDALIYLAGHGLRLERFSSEKGYFSDSNNDTDAENAIPFTDLNTLFAQARSEAHLSSLVVLLDCCHAGLASEGAVEREIFQSSFTAFQNQPSYGMLASCRGHQESYELGEHGLFTSKVLEGLEQGNADENGVISFNRLADYVNLKLQNMGQESVDLAFNGSAIQLVSYSENSISETTGVAQNNFIQALQELNYTNEDRLFTDFLEVESPALPVGAFWIRSEEGGGQRWLINRLWQKKVPCFPQAIKYPFFINKRWTIETIWEKVGATLGVGTQPGEIVEELYQFWVKPNTVALALYGVERLTKADLEELFVSFWRPLTQKAAQQTNSDLPLLLFLIDTGIKDNCDCCLEHLQEYDCLRPWLPVEFPLEPFKRKSLINWANNHHQIIQPLLRNCSSMQEFNQELEICNCREDLCLEEILGEICQLCGHDWKEHLERTFTI